MRFTTADYVTYEEALDMGADMLRRLLPEYETMELDEEWGYLWEASVTSMGAALDELGRRQMALDALIAARPREWEGLLSQMEACHA